MKSFPIIALLTALCGAAPAIVLADMAAPSTVTVPLRPENGSAESGSATLTQTGPDVTVTVHVDDAVATTQPMHIHEGTCANLNPKPKYPLALLKDGDSYTVLKGVELSSLLASPFAINIHKSPNDIPTYVACGDIKSGSSM